MGSVKPIWHLRDVLDVILLPFVVGASALVL